MKQNTGRIPVNHWEFDYIKFYIIKFLKVSKFESIFHELNYSITVSRVLISIMGVPGRRSVACANRLTQIV